MIVDGVQPVLDVGVTVCLRWRIRILLELVLYLPKLLIPRHFLPFESDRDRLIVIGFATLAGVDDVPWADPLDLSVIAILYRSHQLLGRLLCIGGLETISMLLGQRLGLCFFDYLGVWCGFDRDLDGRVRRRSRVGGVLTISGD